MSLENDFINTNNKFLISHYGNANALGFKGTKQFIEKAYNLCFNHGITDGRLICLEDGFYYILTNRDKLFKGLKSYFVNELKFKKILPFIKDQWNDDESEYLIEYNEDAIEKLAQQKTEDFILKYIVEDNFMMPFETFVNNQFYETRLLNQKFVGKNTLNDLENVRDDV